MNVFGNFNMKRVLAKAFIHSKEEVYLPTLLLLTKIQLFKEVSKKHSLEDLSHGREESLRVLLGRHYLRLDLETGVGLLAQHLELFLQVLIREVVNNSEVNLTLDYSMLGIEDNLFDDISGCEFVHLVPD